MSRPPEDDKVVGKYLSSLDFTPVCQPRKGDGTKYTGEELCRNIQEGWMLGDEMLIDYDIYCGMGTHHATAIVKGKVVDTWDCTGGKVGKMYIKLRK